MQLPIEVIKEGNSYIGYIHALDVASQGDTPEEAAKNTAEAADIFIEECSKRGTLDQVLLSLGWVKRTTHRKASFNPPIVVANINHEVQIPA